MHGTFLKSFFIMRNIFVFSFFAILFLVTSCTKEPILIPETNDLGVVAERSITIEIEVTEITNSRIGGELLIDFQAAYDFSEAVLEPTQYLNFVDGSGNQSTLSFQVNSFTGSNGALDVNFAVGANNLNGLELLGLQEIIIEDDELE